MYIYLALGKLPLKSNYVFRFNNNIIKLFNLFYPSKMPSVKCFT